MPSDLPLTSDPPSAPALGFLPVPGASQAAPALGPCPPPPEQNLDGRRQLSGAARAGPVSRHKSQHKTHQSQALIHFSTILFWSQALRTVPREGSGTGIRAGQEAAVWWGRRGSRPACAHFAGTDPGGELSPQASLLSRRKHRAHGAAGTAAVPCYRVRRQRPSPQGAGQGAWAGPSPSCAGKWAPGCGVSRRPHPEWKAQPRLFLPPSSAAPRALAEEEPLGCLQQAPPLFLQA